MLTSGRPLKEIFPDIHGVSSDYPLAGFYLGARTLRIADGPDEVHKILIARNILRHYHSGASWDFG